MSRRLRRVWRQDRIGTKRSGGQGLLVIELRLLFAMLIDRTIKRYQEQDEKIAKVNGI